MNVLAGFVSIEERRGIGDLPSPSGIHNLVESIRSITIGTDHSHVESERTESAYGVYPQYLVRAIQQLH